MGKTLTMSTDAADPTPVPARAEQLAEPPARAVTGDEITGQPADLDALLALVEQRLGRAEPPAHPLARFASYGDYALHVKGLRGEEARAAQAELVIADQITTNNPGVVPPSWSQEVKGNIERTAKAIEASGGMLPLSSVGMESKWPVYAGDLSTVVGEQLTEKSEITSVRVDLTEGSAALRTFAGGSDISWQLLTRSSPAYLDAYLRILANAYTLIVDNAYVDALEAGGTGSIVYDFITSPTADGVRAAFFEGSALVEDATGQPASYVLAAPDVYEKLGSLSGLYPEPYGTQNVAGTATASTLRVNVSGLEVIRHGAVAAGTIVMSNSEAARWTGQSPMPASADNVNFLGRDVAVWGMGAAEIYLPAGIVKSAAVVAAGQSGRAKGK